INVISLSAYTGGGVLLEDAKNPLELSYQAGHHQFVASALATKLAHEIIPGSQVGCMLARMATYPATNNPDDILKAQYEGCSRTSGFCINSSVVGISSRFSTSAGFSCATSSAMRLEVSREPSSSSGSLFVVSLSCAIETLALPKAIKSTEIIRTTR
ncbi:family 1 glycosylhydrolase, partial [Listeria monocytogenes]|uniref:family 1 glycosylhydrolase n=1 Tax=Listeria monocytogenes TaxID=1639 RepID=UPI003204C891